MGWYLPPNLPAYVSELISGCWGMELGNWKGLQERYDGSLAELKFLALGFSDIKIVLSPKPSGRCFYLPREELEAS
jgi:hypothetical protein